MEFRWGHDAREQAIAALFQTSFAASEGDDEGKVIADLVCDLMATTPDRDLSVWSAYEGDALLGCVFFSRLTFDRDDRSVFILSPIAVRTDRQKTGIGQGLIARGVEDLRRNGVDLAVTYGDPAYYARAGFRQITEAFVQAPLALSVPAGWLGQALSPAGNRPFAGACRCVAALNRPALW